MCASRKTSSRNQCLSKRPLSALPDTLIRRRTTYIASTGAPLTTCHLTDFADMTDLSLLSFTPTNHSDTKTHKATEWQGKKTIQVNDHPLPLLTDPVSSQCQALLKYLYSDLRSDSDNCAQNDVILRVTATAICGSDLHLYLNAMPGRPCCCCSLCVTSRQINFRRRCIANKIKVISTAMVTD